MIIWGKSNYLMGECAGEGWGRKQEVQVIEDVQVREGAAQSQTWQGEEDGEKWKDLGNVWGKTEE